MKKLPLFVSAVLAGMSIGFGGLAFPERGPGPDTVSSLRSDSVRVFLTVASPGIAGRRPPYHYSLAGEINGMGRLRLPGESPGRTPVSLLADSVRV